MFHGKIHYFDWAMFNNYFDITRPGNMKTGYGFKTWLEPIRYIQVWEPPDVDSCCGHFCYFFRYVSSIQTREENHMIPIEITSYDQL